MKQTMTYRGYDALVNSAIDAGNTPVGRSVSLLGGIGVATQLWMLNMAGPRFANVTGIGVPSGRRLLS